MHLKGEQHLAEAPVTLGLVFPFLPSYFSVPPLILSHSFSSVRIQRCQDDVRTEIINDLFVHWLLLLMLIKLKKRKRLGIGKTYKKRAREQNKTTQFTAETHGNFD